MNRPLVIAAASIVLAFAAVSIWRVTEDDGPSSPPHSEAMLAADAEERQRKAEFWRLYRQATELRMAGKRSDASAAYERALALDADHQDALYYLGNMLADLQTYDAARAKWERLVAVNPTSSRGHARLGDLFFCVGNAFMIDLERAGAHYNEAHEINKEETGHLLRLGELALATEAWSDARRYFEDVIASNTSSMEVPFFLAYLDHKAGRADDAMRRLERARSIQQPETPEGMTGEGDTRSDKPRFERAGCPELHDVIAGLESVPREQLQNDAELRFEQLDQWLEIRRRAIPASPAGAANRAPAPHRNGS